MQVPLSALALQFPYPLGLVCFFEFLIGVVGNKNPDEIIEFNSERDNFFTIVSDHDNKPITFLVYNMLLKDTR